jgi:hypothetical protein
MDRACPRCSAPLGPDDADRCPTCGALLATPPEHAARDHRVGLGVSLLLTGLLYRTLAGAFFSAEGRAKAAEIVDGPEAFGVPAHVLVFAVVAVLILPVAWIGYHAGLFQVQAFRDDRAGVSGPGRRHPHLARSRRIVAAGFAYFLALAVAWIVYAAYRGI